MHRGDFDGIVHVWEKTCTSEFQFLPFWGGMLIFIFLPHPN
jgi:hypothetical protein